MGFVCGKALAGKITRWIIAPIHNPMNHLSCVEESSMSNPTSERFGAGACLPRSVQLRERMTSAQPWFSWVGGGTYCSAAAHVILTIALLGGCTGEQRR